MKLPPLTSKNIFPKTVADHMNPPYEKITGRVALVDADLLGGGTKFPNLVVMKLSAYFKEKGCSVELIENIKRLTLMGCAGAHEYDAIFVAKVFTKTAIDKQLLEQDNVWFGGTGFFFDYAPKLPAEIEHHMPDYHIYDSYIAHDKTHTKQRSYWKDYKDFSIGFATRGCFRQCPFCVNHHYKKVTWHSHIREWYDPTRKYIYLWDDNIFAYPHWKEVFQELKEINKPFQFKQGMDIRLLDKDRAIALNDAKYYGDIIFAFDNIEDKEKIEEKLKFWRKYCNKNTKLYVLSGFAGQDEKEIEGMFERIQILFTYKCYPYIMRHENYLKSQYREMFVTIARWCNQPAFVNKMSFRQFVTAESARNKIKISASKIAFQEFEEKFPAIAEKYFDMRMEDISIV